MFFGCLTYRMRGSNCARSRHNVSVPSSEALSLIKISIGEYVCARMLLRLSARLTARFLVGTQMETSGFKKVSQNSEFTLDPLRLFQPSYKLGNRSYVRQRPDSWPHLREHISASKSENPHDPQQPAVGCQRDRKTKDVP